MKLIIENIRSFAGHHEYDIRPLTILVGENSSGKSTFLATLGAVSDSVSFPSVASFNKAPYDLGTFDTIATYKGGRGGRAKEFSVGYETVGKTDRKSKAEEVIRVVATFGSESGEARIRQLQLIAGPVSASMLWEREKIVVSLSGIDGLSEVKVALQNRAQAASGHTLSSLLQFLHFAIGFEPDTVKAPRFESILKVQDLVNCWANSAPQATSISPIRSEPKRTYDRMSAEYDPSGDHVPYILARLFLQNDGSKNDKLLKALEVFGNDSGLFKKIAVKPLGKKVGDPFQIQVGVGGQLVNLSDVGYGVSQSLPIIVESILRATGARILLQQPEVHLHPKAQAALGTFFSKLVADGQRQFVIETHSDHLIDRIRQEVASGALSPDAVRILFFDRPNIETTVSELSLDRHGNILNAPNNYRSFFLEEEMKLLGRANL